MLELNAIKNDKEQNVRRLEAQRNSLNSQVLINRDYCDFTRVSGPTSSGGAAAPSGARKLCRRSDQADDKEQGFNNNEPTR